MKIHSFFRNFRTRALVIFVMTQLATVALVASLSLWSNLPAQIILAITVTVYILTSVVLITVLTRPLQILSQAVAHVSKDPVTTPPPDVNKPRYERTGLKELVQTVYELSVSSMQQPAAEGAKPGPSDHTEALEHLANNLPGGLIIFNKQRQIVFANQSAPATKNTEGRLEMTLQFDQNDNFEAWLADCEKNKITDTHVWKRVSDKLPSEPDRRIYDVITSYHKQDPAGAEVVLITIDHTATYAPEQEDMDFIALAAHELRGPITVIRGYLDIFDQELGKSLAADQKVLIDRLKVSSERLSTYINNILNVSRFDRNKLSTHIAKDSMQAILNSIGPDLVLRAQTQGRQLSFQVPADLPPVAADRNALTEVIVNLVDNAIKYTNANGQIAVSAKPKDNFFVEVTVQDNGIGIPTSIASELFNRFYRSHRSSENVGGTGLGLYICRALVKAHGGEIWVRTAEGKGSVFGFTVPTYDSIAPKLQAGDNYHQDQEVTQRTEGWIKNHAMIRR